ncbi:hypothetical protein OTK49_02330 [Vibrio coralliirubri]|uniref:hypothetical protein n=1 Tax=Vibrio coralliirubri TaxID=1516159 RepID=UPI0022845870|nr:hypothetical protein [Vibrio coralliirubri]MCY9861353.1 hypothetical protein [Vibrio coralliirubri]
MVIYTNFEMHESLNRNTLLFTPVSTMPDYDVVGTVIGELVMLSNRQTYLRVKHPDGVFAIGNFNERQLRALQEKELMVGFKWENLLKVVPVTLLNC